MQRASMKVFAVAFCPTVSSNTIYPEPCLLKPHSRPSTPSVVPLLARDIEPPSSRMSLSRTSTYLRRWDSEVQARRHKAQTLAVCRGTFDDVVDLTNIQVPFLEIVQGKDNISVLVCRYLSMRSQPTPNHT
ncbi:hypothetical protein BD310DRAFT_926608 [Dichomitus squalens]|uniref:Uncharacterized protein n=1 Tax=Dichomitus squalens TaxID=114155 RepID=A0A4V2K847_9APHY|nr:hypothetical protein BD310DRAFT_926608 [Dichomitus squalens]